MEKKSGKSLSGLKTTDDVTTQISISTNRATQLSLWNIWTIAGLNPASELPTEGLKATDGLRQHQEESSKLSLGLSGPR